MGKHIEISKILLNKELINTKITVKGWVRTKRESKNIVFIALNDGSSINNLQIVFSTQDIEKTIIEKITTGASLSINGKLVKSNGKEQNAELQAINIEILGISDPDKFPLQPKKHSLEFLRNIAHLRFRTNTFGAIFRIRHVMSFAVHQYFHNHGFFNLHSPIITGSDCEGAGEMFRVTTLNLDSIRKNEDGTINYSEDFFGKETNLTVSGQLEAELAALALGKVYTFGPTFRAENSNTTRHLSEFWMIEPEVAFADLNDNMDLAEDLLKYIIQYTLENCKDDLNFLNTRFQNENNLKPLVERSEIGLIEKLNFVLNNKFKKISYTEAFDILKSSKPNKKKKFKYLIEKWGVDLQSEHERYLVEKHFKSPVILYDYPAKIKAFYMKLNEDKNTVKAMDIIFPQIGEIVGGSQREERLDILESKMKEMNIPIDQMQWYLDTRRFGTVAHSGFGLGFERLVQFITGMENIRDVIPFSRTPKNAEF